MMIAVVSALCVLCLCLILMRGLFPAAFIRTDEHPAGLIALIFIAGTLFRLLLAYYTYGNYDMDSWQLVAEIVRKGGNVYAQTPRYPYSPIWALLLGLLKQIQLGWPAIPFHFLIKSLLTCSDLLTAAFLMRIARRQELSPVTTLLMFYLNPISILLTGVHGQFESLAMLPLIVGLDCVQRSKEITNLSKVSLWAGASLAMWIKHSLFFEPILCVLAIVRKPRAVIGLLFLTLLGFFALFLPYWTGASHEILDRLFHYPTHPRRYGIGWIFPAWGRTTVIYLVIACLFPFMIRKMELIKQSLLGVLFFIVFTPIIGIQYFVLPLALGALRPSRALVLYTLIGTFFVLGSPVNLHAEWFSFARGNYLWMAALYWFIWELSQGATLISGFLLQ